MSTNSVVSVQLPSGPLFDPKTGNPTFAFIKWMQNIGQVINQAFDLQGNVSADSIPSPTASTLGGVLSVAAQSHEFVAAIDTSGKPHLAQPSFTDISGTASPSQVPPLSSLGDLNASQIAGTLISSQVPVLSDLSGAVTANQVPPLSALNGQITPAQLPHSLYSGTITTAKLTVAGVNGSMTFLNGSLLSEVAAT